MISDEKEACMMELIKQIIGILGVSPVVFGFIGTLLTKYIQFHRRDFFSRSAPEQIKALKWIRKAAVLTPDPLEKVEQQIRLQSFGLHRDFELSSKIICFQSVRPQSLTPLLKTVLRYQGMYKVVGGNIYPNKYNMWLVSLVFLTMIFFFGFEVYIGLSNSDRIQAVIAILTSAIAVMVWFWVAVCAWEISHISKKLNVYVPPSGVFESSSDEFNKMLNNTYP